MIDTAWALILFMTMIGINVLIFTIPEVRTPPLLYAVVIGIAAVVVNLVILTNRVWPGTHR